MQTLIRERIAKGIVGVDSYAIGVIRGIIKAYDDPKEAIEKIKEVLEELDSNY
jgi:hypothetical protein